MKIDDFGPLEVHSPDSIPELQEAVRNASAEGQALYPMGGGTQMDIGLPPRKAGKVIRTTALSQVIDYPARDMTITVQAGITI